MDIKAVVDLRHRFGPIRHQRQRPTCMAFAASDAHAFAREDLEPLSTEYAFYHAVQRKPIPDRTRGVSYQVMAQTLSEDGQPSEAGWPYLPNLKPTDPWAPPAGPATIYRRTSKTIGKSIDEIVLTLTAGSAVLLVTEISVGFYTLAANAVLPPFNGEPRTAFHAMVAVGHGEFKGDRCLLLRNSWGDTWAGEGYGWVHEEYLAPRLVVAAVMN